MIGDIVIVGVAGELVEKRKETQGNNNIFVCVWNEMALYFTHSFYSLKSK